MKNLIRSLTVLLSLLVAQAGVWASPVEVNIGVLAKRGYEKSQERWEATADYLNASIPGYHFKIVPMTFGDIPVIVKNQLVDFVVVNPGIYVDLAESFGVRRILTLVNELSPGYPVSQFGSVIFTLRSNSEIHQLKDLKNQRIAAVHSTSLGGWIMALREFKAEGLDRWDFASLLFMNTHDAVVEAVSHRKAEAGIVRTDTLERMAMEGLIRIEDFRVLSLDHYEQFPYMISTPLYPEWPFSILPHTSAKLAKQVSIALLKLPADHPAAQQAHIHGWTIPETYQSVNDLLRTLELPPYDKSLPEKFGHSLSQSWPWYLAAVAFLGTLLTLGIHVIRLKRALLAQQTSLESSRQAQLATFELAAVGLAHITPAGEFLQTNRKLCELLSLTPQEMKGLNLMKILYEEDLPPCIQAFDQLRENQQASASIQVRMLCANSNSKWIQLSLSAKKAGDVNLDDYYIAVIDDIDSYKRLEEQNRLTQRQKELILNIAGDGIIGLDAAGRHMFVNPAAAEMLGYTIDEMLGRDSHELWHYEREDGEKYPVTDCPITDVLKDGQIRRGDREVIWHKNGSPIEVEYISTPIMEGQKVAGAVVVLHLLANSAQGAAVHTHPIS
ncbi:MAG: PhnD/SsuA/transferrin family substrate-binding protein [Candidatus Thiodiazotropha sp.]